MKQDQPQIIFQNPQNYCLTDINIENYCLFSITRPFLSQNSSSLQSYQSTNKIETFLLVDMARKGQLQKCLTIKKTNPALFVVNLQNKQKQKMFIKHYNCNLLRYTNLGYYKKISILLQTLNINTNMENQWFGLYEVPNYPICSTKKLSIQIASYGVEILINSNSTIKRKSCQDHESNIITNKLLEKTRLNEKARIGNLFQQNSQNFYFLSSVIDGTYYNNLQLITSVDQRSFMGFLYKINDENLLCLPLQTVLFEIAIQMRISKTVKDQLMNTCYVEYLGNYCTGVMINQNRLITTKHLLPGRSQSIQICVNVRKYPYKNIYIGKVINIGLGNLDLMIIELKDKNTNKLYSIINKKQKSFVKYEIDEQKYQQKQCNTKYNTQQLQKHDKFKVSFDVDGLHRKYKVGDQIFAIGFGKFSYPSHIFNKMELCLPCIATGIISKLIKIQGNDIYLKSDLKLYSGFSGSGLWKDGMIAMAVFILKNKNSNSKYHKHNFSYTIQFIQSVLQKSNHKQLLVGFNKELEEFDQVNTRKNLKFIYRNHQSKL